MIDRTKRNIAFFMAAVSFCLLFVMLGKISTRRSTSDIVSPGKKPAFSSKTEDPDLLKALYFNEQQLFYDRYEHTFYYSLIEGDKNAYAPAVTFESGQKHVEVTLSEEITDDVIRNNRPILLTVENGDSYMTYTLKCTTLPLLSLTCDEELTFDPSDMTMTVFDNREDTGKRRIESSGTLHVRGMSSAEKKKKGFRLALTKENASKKNKVSLLGMRSDEDWILIPAYTDAYRVRNTFSSNLWTDSCGEDNAFGIVNGNHYEYLELFMNGRYWGLYALGYPIDQNQLEIDPENDEYIYKKRFWDNGSDTDYVSSAWKVMSPYGEECSNCTLEWKPLQDHYHLLNEHPDDFEALRDSVDMDAAIDLYLFYGLIQGIDNVEHSDTENVMLTAKKDEDGNYRMLYTAWDMDLTWGEFVANEEKNTMLESGVIGQLINMKDPGIFDDIMKKYKKLRNTDWSDENIDRLLDFYEEKIYGSGAFARDTERWPESIYYEGEKDLSAFRAYVHNRFKEYDDYLERWYKNRNESVYVTRSTQYKNFQDWRFIIQLRDHSILEEPDYKALFLHIGLDPSQIPEEAQFIVYDGENRTAVCLESLGEERTSLYTEAGRIIYERCDNPRGIGDDFMIYLDGEPVLEIWQWPEVKIRMGLIRNHEHDEFNFKLINEYYLVD